MIVNTTAAPRDLQGALCARHFSGTTPGWAAENGEDCVVCEAPVTFGPRVAREVKSEAEMVYLWSRDLQAAAEAGDVQRVADLARVIAEVTTRLEKRATTTARQARLAAARNA